MASVKPPFHCVILGLKILTDVEVRSGFKPQYALWKRRFIPMPKLGFALSLGILKGHSPLRRAWVRSTH